MIPKNVQNYIYIGECLKLSESKHQQNKQTEEILSTHRKYFFQPSKSKKGLHKNHFVTQICMISLRKINFENINAKIIAGSSPLLCKCPYSFLRDVIIMRKSFLLVSEMTFFRHHRNESRNTLISSSK